MARGSKHFPKDYRQFWPLFQQAFVNICGRSLGICQKLLSWAAGQNQRSETQHALGAKSGAVLGPEILFASIYTTTSGTNTYTLYNKACWVWCVFIEVSFKRIKAASLVGLMGISALERAWEGFGDIRDVCVHACILGESPRGCS